MNPTVIPTSSRLQDGTPNLDTVEGRRIAFGERIAVLTGDPARGGYGMAYNAALQKMRETPADAKLLQMMGDLKVTAMDDPAPSLATPEKRSALFHARLDLLMAPKQGGGEGLTLEQALEEMRSSVVDRPLLLAMGATYADPAK